MKRFLIGLIAVAIAGSAAWLVLRRDAQRIRQERAELRLLQFDARQLRALVWTADGVDWRFERVGDAWRLVAPLEDAASAGEISMLLSVVANASAMQRIGDPDPLSSYGLDPPFRALRLEGVEAPALHVGDLTPTGEGMFARIADQDAVLVLDYITGRALRVEPAQLRDRRLSSLPRSEVDEILIEESGRQTALRREGESWWLVRPLRLPAGDGQVERLLASLDESVVEGFLDDADPADSRFGLAGDATTRITLRSAETTRIFTLGAAQQGLRYVRRDDRAGVLAVGGDRLVDLPLDESAMATTKLTSVNRYLVERFEYRREGSTLSAARDGEVWMSLDGRRLQEGQVYRLLVGLLEARVRGYESSPTVADRPIATLEFKIEDGSSDRIEFYGGRRARLASLPEVTFRLAADPPPIPSVFGSG